MKFNYKQYIKGEWIDARNGGEWEVSNPATGKIITKVPFGDASDVQEAIEAADNVFSVWATSSPYERANILNRASCLIEENVEAIAKIMTLESGKPLEEAK